MISNWKLGMKILRYSYGIKTNLFVAAALLGMNVLYIFPNITTYKGILSGCMLMSVGLLPTQMLYSLSASNMVQASPCKKRMQTSVPAAVTFGSMALMYLVAVLERGIIVLVRPDSMGWGAGSLLIQAALMMTVMLYMGIAYKYFVAATLCFIPALMLLLTRIRVNSIYEWNLLRHGWFSFGMAIILGLAALAAGALLQYFLTLLLYRVPLSKAAQVAPLRRELKGGNFSCGSCQEDFCRTAGGCGHFFVFARILRTVLTLKMISRTSSVMTRIKRPAMIRANLLGFLTRSRKEVLSSTILRPWVSA